jgi:hypothetical protein
MLTIAYCSTWYLFVNTYLVHQDEGEIVGQDGKNVDNVERALQKLPLVRCSCTRKRCPMQKLTLSLNFNIKSLYFATHIKRRLSKALKSARMNPSVISAL